MTRPSARRRSWPCPDSILFGFLIAHMLGNLQFFLGKPIMNHYAETLHGNPPLLWTVRIVLLVSVVLHIWSSIELALLKKQARPVGYVKRGNVQASLGVAYDDVERADRPRVHRFSPSASDDRHHSSSIRPAACLRKSRQRFPGSPGCPLLYRRDDPRRDASEPWNLEHVPVAGFQPSADTLR